MNPLSADLNGCRVLVTRTRQQNESLVRLISQRQGVAISFPCMELEVLPDQLQQGLQLVGSVSDVILTSANAVHVLAAGSDQVLSGLMDGKRVVVVGQKTARALSAFGVTADVVAESASQLGLVETYQSLSEPDSVLLFRAEDGSKHLSEYFRSKNIPFYLSKIYRMKRPDYSESKLVRVKKMLLDDDVDAVLLGSARTAEHYVQLINDLEAANRPILVGISEQVACAAAEIGLQLDAVAEYPGFDAMLDALQNILNKQNISLLENKHAIT